MKKALSFIVAAVMFLTALPLTASAETAAITMTPAITDAVYDYLDEIYIGKYPELGLDFSFGSDADKEVLQTLADTITKNCSTDEEKAMAVAGWADRNIRYRSYTANNGTYYFPIDVFYYREGNCLGLGLFISQVLRLAGVPAVFCAGTRGDMQDYVKLENREIDHGWVMVYYNGTWNLFDPLFDVFGTNDREFISHWYFTDFMEGVSPYYEGMNFEYVYYGRGIFYIDGRFMYYVNGIPASEHYGTGAEGGGSLNGCVPYFTKNRYAAPGGGGDGFYHMDDPDRRNSMINDECYSDGWIRYGEWLDGYANPNGIIAGCTIREYDGQTLYLTYGSSPVILEGKSSDYSLMYGTITAGVGETFVAPEPMGADHERSIGRVLVYESVYPEVASISDEGVVTTLQEGYASFLVKSKDSYEDDTWFFASFVEIYITDDAERVPDYSDSVFCAEKSANTNIKPVGTKSVATRDGTTAEAFLADVIGATVRDVSGEAVEGDAILGSGMTVSLPDGTEYTVVVKGDLDSDGEISASDARLTLRSSVGLEKNSSGWFTEAGNVEADNDGKKLTAGDARLILRASVGLENREDWFNSIA